MSDMMYRSLLKRFFAPQCFLGLFALGFLLAVYPSTVQGASYDYYVKEGEDGDGSEDDPFGSIKDAIEAIDDDRGKKVYVASGSYGGEVTIPKDTTIVGSDPKQVTITGDMILADGVELKKLGFSGAGDVLVTKNARVVLENLRFKDISRTAIKTEPGNTVLVLRDSMIEKAGKGMYLQAGTRVEIEGVEVVGGREEGIDIRENVSGYIKKSSFRSNAESGIEIVLGSADMAITDNTFSGNGASGVAAQFFDGAKKLGNVRVEGNTFSKNDWGVECKAPKGRLDSSFYYLNSLKILNNVYQSNKSGEIAPACKILTDEERLTFEKEAAEQEALIAERKATLTLSEAVLADRLSKSIEFRATKVAQYATEERTRLEPLFQTLNQLTENGKQEVTSLAAKRSAWTCYLLGVEGDVAELNRTLEALDRLRTELGQAKGTLYEPNQLTLTAQLSELEVLQQKIRETLASPMCRFSLLGWTSRFWPQPDTGKLFGLGLETLQWPEVQGEAKALFLGHLGYYPRVREVAVRSGDEHLVTGLLERAMSYAAIIGDLRYPLGGAEDPLPPPQMTSEYSFPVRFGNIFAGANIRALHVSASPAQIQINPDAFKKTGANLAYANIQTIGAVSGGVRIAETQLGERVLHWVDYREGENLDVLRQVIAPFTSNNEPVVVLLSWDEKQGKVMTPKREALVRDLVQAGAALVIGTGVMAPFEQKLVDGVPFYFSLGSAFEKFQTGDASKKSVALEMQISSDGKLEIIERNLTFTAEKGLELLP